MASLPKQRLTFFFSDIEGSTRLIQRLGEAYAPVLEKYQETIREAFSRHQGREIDTAGDGFFGVFQQALDAVEAAVLVQQTFAKASWATAVEFRARIGLHTGDAIPVGKSFIGLEVHRASRICHAAHGGQVLLSQATFRQIRRDLPDGVALKALGSYILKDFDLPEHLYQLLFSGVLSDFPQPRTEPPMTTVAVLPFRNLSQDPQQEYFCDGMAEELTIALGKIPGLRLVARSSAFSFKGQSFDAREIGRRLEADVILEGAVRKNKDRLRITVELVDVATGINIWSGGFDGQLEDVFSVQDEIAQQVAAALKIKLVSRRVRDIRSVHTGNVQAYDFYLHGRQRFYQFSPQAVQEALTWFRRAVELDGNYSLAYCGLANCYSYLFLYVDDDEEFRQAADRASRRAIELDSLLAEAYVARGQALSLNNRFESAEGAFEKAIDLDPRLFEARFLFARVCFSQGKLEKAARLYEEANNLRPEDYQSAIFAGQVYSDLGLHRQAEEARRRGIAIAEKDLELNPSDTRALYLGANGLVALGELEKGREWLERALEIDPDDPMLLYNAACVYALLGETDLALGCLERSFEEGVTHRGWYEHDSNLDSLRGEERFKRLLGRIR